MFYNAMPQGARSRPRFHPPLVPPTSAHRPPPPPVTSRPFPAFNPNFAITRPGFHVRLAHDADRLQTKVRELVESLYGARGLQLTGATPMPQRAGQMTLAACSEDQVFGTLTLGIDTPAGLLADTLYRREIDEVRRNGGQVCEVTRLAVNSPPGSPDVMATIFNLAFVLARNVHGMTDLFAEVHPRHAGFYQRMMGYRVAGPERTCPRVGAPAVLMHLCLDYAESQIHKLAGNPEGSERSLYRLFLPPPDQNQLLKRLLIPAPIAP